MSSASPIRANDATEGSHRSRIELDADYAMSWDDLEDAKVLHLLDQEGRPRT